MATNLSASQLLSAGADAVYLSKRAPPTAPTGFYDYEITPTTDDDTQAHSKLTNLLNRVGGLYGRVSIFADCHLLRPKDSLPREDLSQLPNKLYVALLLENICVLNFMISNLFWMRPSTRKLSMTAWAV